MPEKLNGPRLNPPAAVASGGGSAPRASGASARAHQAPLSPEVAAALASLEREFGEALAAIRQARVKPEDWPKVARRPDFRRLMLRLRHHLVGVKIKTAAGAHEPVIQAAMQATSLSRPELEQLLVAPTVRLYQGKWLPLSATLVRMADDAIAKPSDDRITRIGDDLCKRHLPDMFEVQAKSGKRLAHFVSERVLPAVDAVGSPTAAGIDWLGAQFDQAGDALCNDVQKRWRQMNDALGPLKVSSRSLAGYDDAEKKMILMTAGVLSQTAQDCDAWLTLLREPAQRRNLGAAKKLAAATRTSLDAVGAVFHHTASLVDTLTDAEAWRLFSFRLEGTAGVEYFGCVSKFGFAATFPSLTEMLACDKPTVKVESCFTPIKTWGGYGEGTGRGFKYTVGGMGSVREAAFSRAVNFKTPKGGIALQTDEALGPGFEFGFSIDVGAPAVFAFLPGFEIAVFHPGFAAWEKPVDWLANLLGNVTEVVCDSVVAGAKVAYGAARAGVQGVAAAVEGAPAAEGAEGAATVVEGAAAVAEGAEASESAGELRDPALGKGRLGRSQRAVRRASVVLGVVRSYRDILAARLAAGEPLAPAGSDVAEELTKGFSAAEANNVIGDFLARVDQRLTDALTRVRELADHDEAHPLDEWRLRAEVRSAAKELRAAQEMFAVADVLLARLFPDPATEPAGPCVDLLEEGQLTPAQQAEWVARHVSLAMSYGAFDWFITKGEAREAFEQLAALTPEAQALCLEKLTPKTARRLIEHLSDEVLKAQAELVGRLRARF